MSVPSRSVVVLEEQAVDFLYNRSVNRTKENPKALLRLLVAYRSFLQTEKDHPIDPNMARTKKKIVLARQYEIIDLIRMEIEQIRILLEDHARFIHIYHKTRYTINQQLIMYMQPVEEGLTTQKNKLLLRMEGFTLKILDNIFDEVRPGMKSTYSELDRANNLINNTIVYKLQTAGKDLVSKNHLPDIGYFRELFHPQSNVEKIAKSVHANAERLVNHYNPMKAPIVLLNALQYLDILCSHNLLLFKASEPLFAAYKTLVHTFITIIPEAFLLIKSWRHAVHLEFIGLFLFQTVQTLRSVLDVMLLLHVDQLEVKYRQELVKPAPALSRRGSAASIRFERSDSINGDELKAAGEEEEVKPPEYITVADESAAEFWDGVFCSPQEEGDEPALLLEEQRYSMHHLVTDLILMLKVVRQARVHNGRNGNSALVFTSHGSVSNYGITPAGSESALHPNAAVVILNENRDHTVIDEHVTNSFNQYLALIASCTSLGSTLVTNLLHCADMVLHIIVKTDKQYQPTVPPFAAHIPLIMDTLPHELLRSALEVGQVCLSQYAIRLGALNCLSSYAGNDVSYGTACDNEAVAITTIATQSFAHGILDVLALDILRMAYDLCIARSGCFLLVSAYFKCNLAACLHVINSSTRPEVSRSDVSRLMEAHYNAKVAQVKEDAALRAKGRAPLASQRSKGRLSKQPPVSSTFSQSNKKLTFTPNASTSATDPAKTRAASFRVVMPARADMSFELAPRADLIAAIGESLLRVMGLMYLYKTSLSLCHSGMLLVRLMTRDLFIRKNKMDEYFTVMLSRQLMPMQELVVVRKETEEEDGEDADALPRPPTPATPGGADDGLSSGPSSPNSRASPTAEGGSFDFDGVSSVSRANTPQDTERRSMSTGGGAASSRRSSSTGRGGASSVAPAEYVKTWKLNNVINVVTNPGAVVKPNGKGRSAAMPPPTPMECSFVELLHFIGENHLQSEEVVEQLLLVVEHIAAKSQLNKYLLMEGGLLPIVQRIRDTTPWDNNYLLALSEICIELIDI